mmetsp:Transcript_1845/g.2462  ORF Transcript_1845/g.2462 Transcript_1845/m.2462 type:complete len:178 (-) Transcript_1845:1507-2040(-)
MKTYLIVFLLRLLSVPTLGFFFSPSNVKSIEKRYFSAPPTESQVEEAPVKRFIEAMEFLGPMRFITVGDSAVLETVAEVEAISYKKMADGTTMATLKSLDAQFEAHLRLETLKRVTMDNKKKGERNLYAIRFMNEAQDDPCLTCLLHSEEGTEPDDETLKYWQGLRDHYGPEFTVEH